MLRSRSAWAALLLIGVATVLVVWLLARTSERLGLAHVEHVTSQATHTVAWRLREQELVLDSCRALFEASEEVLPQEWTSFVRRLLDQDLHAGFTTLGFVSADRPDELSFVESEVPSAGVELGRLVRIRALDEALERSRVGGRPAIAGSFPTTSENEIGRGAGRAIALVLSVRDAAEVAEMGHVVGLLSLERLLARNAKVWSLDADVYLEELGGGGDPDEALGPAQVERLRGAQTFEQGGWRFVVHCNVEAPPIAFTYRRLARIVALAGGLLGLLAFIALGWMSTTRGELVQIVGELETARAQAEAASIAKDRFLANMSHELRTPLNGVVGMVELLLDGPLEQDQRELALTARDSARSLALILTNVLEYVDLGAGRLQLQERPIRLGEVVGGAMELFGARAARGGLELTGWVDPALGATFLGDAARLRQALLHLIDNALRFTERGSVSVRARLQQEESSAVVVRVEVADTGPGIAPEEQARLFRTFSQLDESSTRRHGGVGLGLALTRALVERMGGEVGLTSDPGLGSLFWFTVRLGRCSQPTPGSLPLAEAKDGEGEPHSRLDILLAEDDATNQLIARKMLERGGHAVEVVSDGAQAVERFADGRFDVIVMDCQMPRMDGYAATQAIRSQGGRGAQVPIIALTSHALTGDRERCLDAGMDDYLTKPVDPRRLCATVERWARDRLHA